MNSVFSDVKHFATAVIAFSLKIQKNLAAACIDQFVNPNLRVLLKKIIYLLSWEEFNSSAHIKDNYCCHHKV